MKLAKSLLLGTAATIVATAGAFAADLPSKKAAPATYVKICDVYGAGFFYIPGTDTCIKVGGRVRADYAMSGKQDTYTGGTIDKALGGTVNTVGVAAGVQNLYGWEARGRVDLDARTQTAYGTVQIVAAIRMSRVNGVLDGSGPTSAVESTPKLSTAPTLEAAYIRFAGFTFGAAKDNFSFMPSTFYGAGHFSSFASGAKQIAYTAILGGGFSATLAVQDMQDTTAGQAATVSTGTQSSYNGMPQINGRVDFDQSWGSASLMGAAASDKTVSSVTAGTQASKTAYAIGGGLKVNLPMIAAGDVLWLNAAYASGMSEYTVNWASAKSSDTKRNVGGYVSSSPSWVATANGIELVKSWDVAAIFTHYWAPQWRHSFLGSYGKLDGTATSKATAFAAGGFGDMSVWNVGTQLAFLPTKDFEIGVDVLYARVSQDVRRTSTGTGTAFCAAATDASCVTKESKGNWTGRLRVERTF